jgi:alpha-ketoglutarate-dependent taurine dioxygenase
MTQLTFTNLTPAFGAEVAGIDASAKLDDADEALLRQSFDDRGLLLFRGLEGLPAAYQNYLASVVIGMENAAGAGEKDEDAAYFVSNKRAGGGAPYGRLLFHSDMMWADEPFQVLTLFALEVEPPVVPTSFTSAGERWDALPANLRAQVAGRHAMHVTGQQMRAEEDDGELLRPQRDTVRTTTKPVAYQHPRTGRTLLYVSQMMTGKIVELPDDESEALLRELFDHLYAPAALWTHEWRNGDLVMWDNLAIQHARGNVEIEGPVRTLRKVIAPRPTLPGTTESPKFTKVG